MLGGAESDPVVVPLVGDTAVLGEVGAGAGRGTRWKGADGLCSVEREHPVRTLAVRNKAVSCEML